MGSYIGIGLVYNGSSIEKMKREIAAVINYFVLRDGQLNRAKYSKDEQGSCWIEDNTQDTKFLNDFAKGFFGEIHLTSNILGKRNLEIILRLEKSNEDYFGLLLDISEQQFLDQESLEYIENITEKIIQLLKNIYEISRYDYAICDNEAEIKYAPSTFLLFKDPVYSVALIPFLEDAKMKFKVIRSSWAIDGLTNRL